MPVLITCYKFETMHEPTRKIIVRRNLVNKTEFSKRYNVSKPTIDAMIARGDLVCEEISGKLYIRTDISNK